MVFALKLLMLCTNSLEVVPCQSLYWGGRAVAGRRAILKINSCGQSIWSECAIECGRKTRDVRCRIGYRPAKKEV
jgi:hypothetical protein